MPTYVYRCESCGHRFEAWQHMTDEPLSTCPQCQGPVHRQIFANGVVFKGGGFYSTENRPTKAATDNGSGDNGSSDGEKKTETKTEAPAKTESAPKSDAPASTAAAAKD